MADGVGGAHRWLRTLVIAGVGLASMAVPVAEAATFSVNPTQIFLSERARSGLLTVRNESTETLRFQLTAFAWQQSPSGQIELGPTKDIVFFPALLTLGPREERRIRIGSMAATGAAEKTYRIFVEELPPLERTAGSPPVGVRVLTKMGVPVFLRPTKEAASAALGSLALRDSTFSFTLSNTGTVHVMPSRIAVRALDAAERPIFARELSGWYILAGGRRDFEMAVPDVECARVRSLVVEVDLGSASVTNRFAPAAEASSR